MSKQTKKVTENLENVYETKIRELLHIIMHQPLPNPNDIHIINRIIALYANQGRLFINICSFQYGVIEGKRKERERRKRSESYPIR